MRKVGFIVIFLGFLAHNSYAQELFLKTYDFGTTEDSYQIHNYLGRFFINTGTICSSECSYLTEIDSFGNVIWRTQIPDIDIATGSLIIHYDTITVTGNNDPFNDKFLMAHFSLNGNKISETFEIENSNEKYTRMFHLSSQFFNNRFAVCGAGEREDTSFSLIYVVNNIGELDTLITLEPTNHESDIWDSFIDHEGKLTTYHQVEHGNSPINYRKIYKFNEYLDTVWSYTSELNEENTVLPKGCELHDGRTILSFINPQGIRNIHSVRAINPDGSIDWQHDYPVSGSRIRYIVRLKTLANGDIMGSGVYSELAQTPRINDSPWLFRMNPEGDLRWERTYFDIDPNDNESRRGVFYDFEELGNGDILAVGYFKYDDNDMLIIRVDSNGCLNPDDCHEVNIITSQEILPLEKIDIELFPNPAHQTLYIRCADNHFYNVFKIFDTLGKTVNHGELFNQKNEINIETLPSGIYFISLFENGKRLLTQKFFKT